LSEATDPSTLEAQAADATGPTTVVGGRKDFSARLDSFEGPLDLLLYLIRENEVEITAIPIARILQQYLTFLDAASEWDLHLAGEFLVMATTLMEIKSRELLPQDQQLTGDAIIEDPRSELVRQLLRYRKLKDQAQILEDLAEAGQRRRPRGMSDAIPELDPEQESLDPDEVDFDLYELLAAFERIRGAVMAQVPTAVNYDGETLDQKLEHIERVLAERPFARFAELIKDAHSRADIAMTFVALLELVRRRMVRLLQADEYGHIDVKVQTAEEAEALARSEAVQAVEAVDAAIRDRAEREAKLRAEAEALGVEVDKLPWQRRRAVLTRPKFEGVIKPEDLEELDAEEAEIARRIDAILAAADAISQRFEEAGVAGAPQGQRAPEGEERPLTEADLAPTPEAAPTKNPIDSAPTTPS